MNYDKITIAILAKNKAHCLPLYLDCIKNQTYPKSQICIYVRSNNNNDNTSEILREWCNENRELYGEIFEDYSDVEENVEQYSAHEWNDLRPKAPGKIRQDSMNWAYNNNSHYFVADCDNFIFPNTLEMLFLARVPIIGPLLRTGNTAYSNFHEKCTSNGYYMSTDSYYLLLGQKIKQIVSVDVIHCTYLIRREFIPFLYYSDTSKRHEYVIFSESARKNNIPQFLDTRFVYGFISFADTLEELQSEPWFNKFQNKILIISPQAGFGNRLRALCSGIAVGLREKRDIYYLWEGYNPNVVINMNKLDHFFDMTIKETSEIEFPEIDEILTEWMPGEAWYNSQSEGQKKWPNCKNIKRISNTFNGEKDKILIETSLRLNVSDEEMVNVYQHFFKPKDCYVNYVKRFKDADVGISIRRGVYLYYFPQYNFTVEQYENWMISNFREGTTIYLFSCDWNFRDLLKSKLADKFSFVNIALELERWEVAFIEFLILSYKCDKIYGTPGSSFCEEAGLFGGKRHYSPISIQT